MTFTSTTCPDCLADLPFVCGSPDDPSYGEGCDQRRRCLAALPQGVRFRSWLLDGPGAAIVTDGIGEWTVPIV
jgi:hypothetical protein